MYINKICFFMGVFIYLRVQCTEMFFFLSFLIAYLELASSDFL